MPEGSSSDTEYWDFYINHGDFQHTYRLNIHEVERLNSAVPGSPFTKADENFKEIGVDGDGFTWYAGGEAVTVGDDVVDKLLLAVHKDGDITNNTFKSIEIRKPEDPDVTQKIVKAYSVGYMEVYDVGVVEDSKFSHDVKMINLIRTTIESRLSGRGDISSYLIGGRRVTTVSNDELMRVLKTYETRMQRNINPRRNWYEQGTTRNINVSDIWRLG